MKIYIDSNLLIKRELLRRSGFEQGPKMLDNLCYSQGMIPPPIKLSDGKGVKALYPPCVLLHLKRIIRERKKGLKYADIKESLAEETKEVFAETERVRRHIKADRQARLELSASIRSGHPDYVIYDSERGMSILECKKEIQKIKGDLKEDFHAWDGKSLDRLTHIRQQMDALEVLTAKQRITKTLLQTV